MSVPAVIIRFLLLLILTFSFVSTAKPATVCADDRVRPRAIAISPQQEWIATANRIAGTVSLIEANSVLKDASSSNDIRPETALSVVELEVGREPVDVAWRHDGSLLVAVHRDHCLKVIEQRPSNSGSHWQVTQTVELPGHPFQLKLLTEHNQLLVSLHHPDSVLRLDAETLEKIDQLETGKLPRYFATDDAESWVAVTCELPGEVWCYSLPNGERISRQEIHNVAFNLGQPAVLNNHQIVLPVTVNRDFPVTESNIARGWVVNNRLVRLNVPAGDVLEQRHMNLDMRGHGVADLTGCFYRPQQNQLIVLSSGAQELLLLDLDRVHWPTGTPEDFAPQHLQEQPGILRRVNVGGRPIDFISLNRAEGLIANELGDSLQKINLDFLQIDQTIGLSKSDHETLIATGERLFFDGHRARDGWLSCHTCHFDGHTSGQVFDTLNDATYETKKLTLSLHNVAETEPWTWHGWQPDLTESMEKSLHDTMHGREPVTRYQAQALLAYCETLKPIAAVTPPAVADSRQQQSLQAGRELFFGKAGCSACHEPPLLTSNLRYAVSRVEEHSIYDVFNPPALLGVSSRRRFLHHGRANSLHQVLKLYHRPQETSGVTLTNDEIDNLVNWLQTQ
ncbi:hypothetical protein [Rubinisphaera sp. JC750]|uniref:hypothetical protein n=1 Tax=Rubinisphaera sp. JC750 TaxID=2898658 RepID=UPI001F384001|nr:hypothetical protein [Rubinisphaera sp. JC750]